MQKDSEKLKDALDIADKKDKEYAVFSYANSLLQVMFLTLVIELELDKDFFASKPQSQGVSCSVFCRPGMGCGSFRRCRASKV